MHTANSSLSQAPGSPGLFQSQHSHRLYHATCERPSSTTPRTAARMPRLTREASSESTRQKVVSSFLQEKLQQSRQAESDRSSTWSRANTDVNSSGEFSRSLNSPIKIMETEGHRPQSAAGNEAPKKKGLGVKDMEQVSWSYFSPYSSGLTKNRSYPRSTNRILTSSWSCTIAENDKQRWKIRSRPLRGKSHELKRQMTIFHKRWRSAIRQSRRPSP